MLVLTAQPAAAAWLEARTAHFVVYSEGSEASVREFATRLERFDQGMRRLRNLPDLESNRFNPLTVYVVSDVAAVRRLCSGSQARVVAQCADVAGFYQGRAAGSVAFTPRSSGAGSPLDLNAQTILFHEYSHHFMLQNYSAAYPAWFIEGFAEFNSTASFEKDGAVGFGRPALHRYRGLLAGKPLKLVAMLSADNRKLSRGQRSAIYERGWLLTHYLTFEPKRAGQLAKYLNLLMGGASSLDAAKTAFGDLERLDSDVDAYLRRSKLAYLRLGPGALPVGSVTLRPLTRGETAMMPVRLRSDRGVDRLAAEAVVIDARRIAAAHPGDPGVEVVLAEAEFDAERDDLAEAAADRALALAPTSRDAMLYKARALARRNATAKTADVAAWRAVRGWLVKANKLEPDAAEPLLLFYQSFIDQGVKPTPNAVKGLERAFQLAPQDRGLRMLLARQYLIDARLPDARATLAPLAFDPHAGADNPAARVIALIDSGGGAATAAAALGDETEAN